MHVNVVVFAGNPVLSAMLRLSVVYKVFTQHYISEVVLGEFFIFVFPLTISYGDRVG